MAARNLRYDYFEQLRQAIGAQNIVVAHHRDDNVETVLLNLLRGTGITGLCGIRPRNANIVRPLLCVTRQQIETWLDWQGQPYITDSTNLVPDIKRNRLRLQVIPILKQINPALDDNIQQTIDNLIEAECVLDDAIHKSIEQVTANHKDMSPAPTQDLTVISLSELKKQVSPEQVLYAILYDKGFNGKQIRDIGKATDAPVGKNMAVRYAHSRKRPRHSPFGIDTSLALGLSRGAHSTHGSNNNYRKQPEDDCRDVPRRQAGPKTLPDTHYCAGRCAQLSTDATLRTTGGCLSAVRYEGQKIGLGLSHRPKTKLLPTDRTTCTRRCQRQHHLARRRTNSRPSGGKRHQCQNVHNKSGRKVTKQL